MRSGPHTRRYGDRFDEILWLWLFGGVLLSHTLACAVPSALKGLTSGFGMGPGVSLFAMTTVTNRQPRSSVLLLPPLPFWVGGVVCFLGYLIVDAVSAQLWVCVVW